MPKLSRELIGRFGQAGWRPALIGWGIGIPVVALFWIIVYRFAIGVTSAADIVAFGGMLAQFWRYMEIRGAPSSRQPPIVPQPNADGGLVNNSAIA